MQLRDEMEEVFDSALQETAQRILPLAVADVLESMSSHRPYRPAVGLDAALAELERHQGQLYDAEVVAAAVRLIRERGYRLPQ